MTTLLPKDRRRSRNLFDWTARSALEQNSLDAITGQAATFSRAGLGTAIDSSGRVATFGYGQPRFEWTDDDNDGIRETVRLLYEGIARTNVVLWNRDLTNAAWTKTTMTAAKDQIGADGLLASASSLLATAGNATALQAITLASSARFQSAYVKRLVGTGTVQMTTDGGTTWTTITLTSAFARVSIPTLTLANPSVGFRLVTNGDKIAVDFVQNENGTFQSSVIATTTVAVTRAVDALSFPWNAPPQPMTGLHDAVWSLGSTGGTNFTAWLIASAAPTLVSYLDGTAFKSTTVHDNGTSLVSSQTTTAPSSGQRGEMRDVLQADGSVITGLSVNGGGETVTSASAANALAAAWNTATLTVGGISQPGMFSLRALRFAAGVQSLATMREG